MALPLTTALEREITVHDRFGNASVYTIRITSEAMLFRKKGTRTQTMLPWDAAITRADMLDANAKVAAGVSKKPRRRTTVSRSLL